MIAFLNGDIDYVKKKMVFERQVDYLLEGLKGAAPMRKLHANFQVSQSQNGVEKRATSIKNIVQNMPVLARIQTLKSEHPFWWYHRAWAYLRYREHLDVNNKHVYRLFKQNHLHVSKNTRLRACKTPFKPNPRANRPNQIWGIDMTNVMIARRSGQVGERLQYRLAAFVDRTQNALPVREIMPVKNPLTFYWINGEHYTASPQSKAAEEGYIVATSTL